MTNNIVVIATGNLNKLQEIKRMLQGFDLEIKSMKDVGLDNLEIVEDGITFEENALKKATAVMNLTGHIAIADDSGIEVEYLDWQPGIYSARFAGEKATDAENNEKLLELLKNIPPEKRKGRFVCAIAVAMPRGESFTVRGILNGTIAYELKGKGGFGYDPLFMPEAYNGLSLGEISSEEKNRISHRGQALERMKNVLGKRLKGE